VRMSLFLELNLTGLIRESNIFFQKDLSSKP
jgi:hypothetical protein